MHKSDDISKLKVPPHDLDAEKSLLGGILLLNDAFHTVVDIVEEEDFYYEQHRLIYKSLLELDSKKEPIDVVTLSSHMKTRNTDDRHLEKGNRLDAVGGITYFAMLLESVPTAANIKVYAEIIKEKALVRKLLNTVTGIAEECYDSYGDVEDFLNRAENQIFQVTERQIKTTMVPLEIVVRDTFKRINTLHEKKDMITGIPSGFEDLDRYTAGFQNSELIILAGRPAMGKSAFGVNVALNAADKGKTPVAVFSLEMSKTELGLRLLSMESRLDSGNLRRGLISRKDWPKLTAAAGKLGELPFYIDDTPGMRIQEIQAKARRLKAEKNIGMVVIDYLQLIRGTVNYRNENRVQEISEVSRNLKGIAKELDIPVLALAQVNRLVDTRDDKRPKMADLRESGSIEQDADVILFIYRHEAYYPDSEEARGKAEINIGKQRNGPAGVRAEFLFQKEFTRFEPLAKQEVPPF